MPRNFIATFPFFESTKPKSVAAIYTLAGTEMEDTSKVIAKISAPYSYQTMAEVMSMEIDLPYEDTIGHLQFEFEFEDGSIEKTEYYNLNTRGK